MKVTIDPDSGFCFGVNRAIQTAETELEKGNTVFCLGEMVHNRVQMDQLKSKGLKVITHADLPDMKGKTVMIRAHGEPPEIFHKAEELGITLIDATCPIVTKLQQRISDSFTNGDRADIQIVIYGKSNHPEVVGLSGNAGNAAKILHNESEFTKLDFAKPVRLFSQTTMDTEGYQKIGEAIQQRMIEAGNSDLVINKSVCRQVSARAPVLRKFAADNDVIIFVAGYNSANGAYLFGICKEINERSYFVTNTNDIDRQWLNDVKSVGVSGATSTPGWLIDHVADYLKEIS